MRNKCLDSTFVPWRRNALPVVSLLPIYRQQQAIGPAGALFAPRRKDGMTRNALHHLLIAAATISIFVAAMWAAAHRGLDANESTVRSVVERQFDVPINR